MYKSNLGVEGWCSWAEPVVPDNWLPAGMKRQQQELQQQLQQAGLSSQPHLVQAAEALLAYGTPTAFKTLQRLLRSRPAQQMQPAGAVSRLAAAARAAWGAAVGALAPQPQPQQQQQPAAASSISQLLGSKQLLPGVAAPKQLTVSADGAARPWLQQRSGYQVDTRVKAGTYRSPNRPCMRKQPGALASHVLQPQPHTLVRLEALPSSYDVRNLSGRSYSSLERNQHIPQ
jgi:hypothetical protein